MIKSKRLEKIAGLLPNLKCVIDVGADHGYLEELLLKSNKVEKIIATDISSKSLDKTKIRMQKLGLEGRVELIVADGLQFQSQSKSNTAIIAGIGGVETVNIINGDKVQRVQDFILMPVQNAAYVRDFLINQNFNIEHDETIFEKGKFYSLIKCKRSNKSNWDNKDFGKTDLEEKGEDFKRFVDRKLLNLKYLENDRFSCEEFAVKKKYRENLLKLKGE